MLILAIFCCLDYDILWLHEVTSLVFCCFTARQRHGCGHGNTTLLHCSMAEKQLNSMGVSVKRTSENTFTQADQCCCLTPKTTKKLLPVNESCETHLTLEQHKISRQVNLAKYYGKTCHHILIYNFQIQTQNQKPGNVHL